MKIAVFIVVALTAAVAAPAAAQSAAPAARAGDRPAGDAAAAAPDYRLAVGDKLRIEVYKEAQLSQSLQVRPDGKITLPLVGDQRAAGLTPIELRDAVAESLREYMTNPVVTVIVVETVPPTVYVMGQVQSPGAVPLTARLTALQALAVAGGFTDFAKKNDIRILRKGPRGTETIRFNYKDAMDGRRGPLHLEPGDTIIVPGG